MSSMTRDSTHRVLEERPGRGEAQASAHALTWAFVALRVLGRGEGFEQCPVGFTGI